jgi:hypothetical protein
MSIKINKELAEQHLEELYDYFDVDDEILETESSSEEDALGTAVRIQRHTMIKKIMKGRIEIQGDSDTGIEVIQHLRVPLNNGGSEKSSFTWREPDGIAKLELDKHKEGNIRMFAFIGYLTGINLGGAKKLKGVDLGTAELLAVFFMRT